MKLRIFVGIVFVVASLIKLACLWDILHWSWLQRAAEDPWATYFIPFLLIFVGVDQIYQGLKKK